MPPALLQLLLSTRKINMQENENASAGNHALLRQLFARRKLRLLCRLLYALCAHHREKSVANHEPPLRIFLSYQLAVLILKCCSQLKATYGGRNGGLVRERSGRMSVSEPGVATGKLAPAHNFFWDFQKFKKGAKNGLLRGW